MGNVYLVLTILAETCAVLFMKAAEGFQHRWFTISAMIAYGLGFIFLTMALKSLPAGLANAVWAGASTILVAVCGVWLFKEHLNSIQIISLVLIIVGLVGLNVSGSRA